MKIRGNTIGTPIKPEKNILKATDLTEEEKAQARENIGAAAVGVVFTVKTQEEYDALVEAGEVDETTLYMIVESDSE